MNSRRSFVLGAGGAAISLMAGKASANSRVRVAVLGVNGRGRDHIFGFNALPNAEVVMLCDPDRNVLTERAEQFETKYHRKVQTEQDLRKVFDNKEIDAVSVATPNHWHALATIWACQAGKDVYVEKPGAHNIYEGRKMIEAAHRYNRIVQHGVQLRSSEAIKEAVAVDEQGRDRQGLYGARPGVPLAAVGGPCGQRAHARLSELGHLAGARRRSGRSPARWCTTTGTGIGTTATATWAIRAFTKRTCACGAWEWGCPARITSMGGKFLWDDDKETPETLTSVYHYPEQKKIIQFEVRPWCTNTEGGVGVGNIFYGSEGYLAINGYDSYEVFLGAEARAGPEAQSRRRPLRQLHQSRGEPQDERSGRARGDGASGVVAGAFGEYLVPAGAAIAVRSGGGAIRGGRGSQQDADAEVSRAVCGAGEGLRSGGHSSEGITQHMPLRAPQVRWTPPGKSDQSVRRRR